MSGYQVRAQRCDRCDAQVTRGVVLRELRLYGHNPPLEVRADVVVCFTCFDRLLAKAREGGGR